jgi:hypothetical protein
LQKLASKFVEVLERAICELCSLTISFGML